MRYDVSKVKEIFLAALEIPMLHEREAYVDSACGTDAELRNCVQDMLNAHQKLLTPIPLGPTVAESVSSTPAAFRFPAGTIIDQRYKIIELIAEGGMGAVYRACRVADMRMEVAIKFVKPGMASEQILQRFNIERQALAIMKHENIAKVLDAGTTREGYPYFVMELVKGMPITKFCDDNKLTVHERLELFEKVCSAVQHAHQKGIVHRDLKPSNIMVGLFDDKPVPKVIDFGLAKALNQPLTDDILHTKFGAFVGTWQYTAPEQAVLNNLDIDTRADIYSLGVILYELLTGNPPIEKLRISHALMEEVLRIIREEEPPKPSTRIHSSEQLPSIAALRRSEPVQLEREIRGELDWIVMKALEKDRNRRFATANELGSDIRRYLAGEAVLSGPVSWHYRLRKLVKRNRGPALAIAVILISLFTGAVAAGFGYWKALQSEKQARIELDSVSALLGFIEDDVFAGIDPFERARIGLPVEDNTPVKKLLDRAVAGISNEGIVNQPLIHARFRRIIGKAYFAIGNFQEARLQLQHSVRLYSENGPSNGLEFYQLMESMGNVNLALGNYEEAFANFSDVFGYYQKADGETSRNAVLASIKMCMVDRGKARNKEALQSILKRFEGIAASVNNKDMQDIAVKANMNIADIYKQMGDEGRSLVLLEKTYEMAKSKLGESNPATLAVMNNYATALQITPEKNKALQLLKDLVQKSEVIYYKGHPLIALYRNNLGSYYYRNGDLVTAEKLFAEAYEVYAQMNPRHRITLTIRSNIAGIRYTSGDFAAAALIYGETVPIYIEKYGIARPEAARMMRDYLCVLARLGRDAELLQQLMQFSSQTLEAGKAELINQVEGSVRDVYELENRMPEYDKLRKDLVKFITEKAAVKQYDSEVVKKIISKLQ